MALFPFMDCFTSALFLRSHTTGHKLEGERKKQTNCGEYILVSLVSKQQ